MANKELPLLSKASMTNGIWMIFHSEKHIVRVWMSMVSGKEIIYVNEEAIVEKRNISSFNTIDSFDHNGDHFDVEIDTESLMPVRINCSVFINGQFIGCKLAVQDLVGAMSVSEEESRKSVQRMLERYVNIGKKELAEYALEDAALHLEKALIIDPKSSEVYYFKACIHSLNEDTVGSISLLEKAIDLGLTGRSRILDEGHLAFIRITDEFEVFKEKHLE